LQFLILFFKFDGYFHHYILKKRLKMENTNNIYETGDKALLELIGKYIQTKRIQQNKTQQQTADAAGINRSTVVQIENGRGGTMLSLIQILRVLQQLHILKQFETEETVSPLLLAKLEQRKRKRVRNKPATEGGIGLSDW
jgi:transcriptional regulator with XRE-family HTH domain